MSSVCLEEQYTADSQLHPSPAGSSVLALSAALGHPEGGHVSVSMEHSSSPGSLKIPCSSPATSAGLHQKGQQQEIELSKSAEFAPGAQHGIWLRDKMLPLILHVLWQLSKLLRLDSWSLRSSGSASHWQHSPRWQRCLTHRTVLDHNPGDLGWTVMLGSKELCWDLHFAAQVCSRKCCSSAT